MITCVSALLCSIAILAVDQLTKYYISSNFFVGESASFIRGLINITYVQNRGVAWGMMSGKTVIILCFTVIIMIICIIVMIKSFKKSKLLFWALNLVISGGIGNIIDRVFKKGIVVDFLQFDFWQSFPVFNIADCAIVIGGGLLILYFIIDMLNEYRQRRAEVGSNKEENEDI